MTKEAHEAYASGAASALQGMNIPEEVKIAAFRYMTKEAANIGAILKAVGKPLGYAGAALGVGAGAVAADRYGVLNPFSKSYADDYQARYGDDYAKRRAQATVQRQSRELQAGSAEGAEIIRINEQIKKREADKRKAALDKAEAILKAEGSGTVGTSGSTVSFDKNLLRNLGYGAAGAAGLYGLYRMTR